MVLFERGVKVLGDKLHLFIVHCAIRVHGYREEASNDFTLADETTLVSLELFVDDPLLLLSSLLRQWARPGYERTYLILQPEIHGC